MSARPQGKALKRACQAPRHSSVACGIECSSVLRLTWSTYHCMPPRSGQKLTKGKMTLMLLFAASDSTRSKRCRDSSS